MKSIKAFLESRRSKKEVEKFVSYIGTNQGRFDELISYCFGHDRNMPSMPHGR
jgi:hypothetical protein